MLLGCWSANRYYEVGDEQAKDEGTVALCKKIQEMIVNYCEHEWELSFSGSIIRGIYCQKCAIKLRGS